ncbi:DUF4167 domain-containing protein, partial [Azospirillum argentinense]
MPGGVAVNRRKHHMATCALIPTITLTKETDSE